MEAQTLAERALGLAPPGFVVADRVNRLRPDLVGQLIQDRDGVAAAQDQALEDQVRVKRRPETGEASSSSLTFSPLPPDLTGFR